MTVKALRKSDLRVMSDVAVERSFLVAFVTLQFKMFALELEGGAVMVKFSFVQRDDGL